jgi:hypothetical protein
LSGQKSISCGGYYSLKSDAYVSAEIEVSQPKFIAHFFCKAPIAAQKIIAETFPPARLPYK